MRYARVVALLGPRQAGKSTLVHKLAEDRFRGFVNAGWEQTRKDLTTTAS